MISKLIVFTLGFGMFVVSLIIDDPYMSIGLKLIGLLCVAISLLIFVLSKCIIRSVN